MFYEGKLLVWKRSLALEVLASVQVRPAAAFAPALEVALFVGATVPTPESVFADFTEPTFSGYARFTTVSPAPVVTLSPTAIGLLLQCLFTSTSPSPYVSSFVDGYFLTDAIGDFYGAERFDEPLPFAQGGDFLTLNALLAMHLAPQTD